MLAPRDEIIPLSSLPARIVAAAVFTPIMGFVSYLGFRVVQQGAIIGWAVMAIGLLFIWHVVYSCTKAPYLRLRPDGLEIFDGSRSRHVAWSEICEFQTRTGLSTFPDLLVALTPPYPKKIAIILKAGGRLMLPKTYYISPTEVVERLQLCRLAFSASEEFKPKK
jgi:hypothetical protein